MSVFFSFSVFTAWEQGKFNHFVFLYGVYFALLTVKIFIKTFSIVVQGQNIANSMQKCRYETTNHVGNHGTF